MKPGVMSRCVAVLATAAFLWTVALGVTPGLHQRIHADQDSGDHFCAATFVRSGSCHHASAPAIQIRDETAAEFATIPDLVSCWVASPFLTAAVFEHAPPSYS
jgi:hypothetical protein